jgi:hypothetical protein
LGQLRQQMEACHQTDNNHPTGLFCPRRPQLLFNLVELCGTLALWFFFLGIFIHQFTSHIIDIENLMHIFFARTNGSSLNPILVRFTIVIPYRSLLTPPLDSFTHWQRNRGMFRPLYSSSHIFLWHHNRSSCTRCYWWCLYEAHYFGLCFFDLGLLCKSITIYILRLEFHNCARRSPS